MYHVFIVGQVSQSPSASLGLNVRQIRGLIRMRALVNFRIDPDHLQRIVPGTMRVRRVGGHGMLGICLIRLERSRPAFIPAGIDLGLGSDNVAYRIAVEWTDPTSKALVNGVFIPRRDTSSALQRFLGGRLFPGEYQHSRIAIDNDGPHLTVAVASDDGLGDLQLVASESEKFAPDSVFRTLDAASRFYQDGAIGYSARRNSSALDGLALTTDDWRVAPLHVTVIESGYLTGALGLAGRELELDNALIMRDVRHTWNALPALDRKRA